MSRQDTTTVKGEARSTQGESNAARPGREGTWSQSKGGTPRPPASFTGPARSRPHRGRGARALPPAKGARPARGARLDTQMFGPPFRRPIRGARSPGALVLVAEARGIAGLAAALRAALRHTPALLRRTARSRRWCGGRRLARGHCPVFACVVGRRLRRGQQYRRGGWRCGGNGDRPLRRSDVHTTEPLPLPVALDPGDRRTPTHEARRIRHRRT